MQCTGRHSLSAHYPASWTNAGIIITDGAPSSLRPVLRFWIYLRQITLRGNGDWHIFAQSGGQAGLAAGIVAGVIHRPFSAIGSIALRCAVGISGNSSIHWNCIVALILAFFPDFSATSTDLAPLTAF